MSSLMRGRPGAVQALENCQPATVFVPQPVIAELAYGLARLPLSRRRENLQSRFRMVLANLRRAEWTDEVSLAFGAAKAELERRGQPLEDFDLAIAAHALARDGVLITDNVRHMRRIPDLALESWE